MRALRWHGAGDLRLDEIEEPGEPGPGQALVEVSYCGICGTDLGEYQHGPSMIRPGPHPLTGHAPPVTLGHEISGRVVALGGTAPGIEVGSWVAVDPCVACGRCRWCLDGDYHICEQGGSIGLAADGGLARLVHAPLARLALIPDGVPDQMAALAEPLAVGVHAARRGGVEPGDAVLVLGCGPIGMAALIGAKVSGAGAIYVSEPLRDRAALALEIGATQVFDPDTVDVRREVFRRTGRVGPDVVIDATGRADAIDLGLRSLRRGGRMVIAGISDATIPTGLQQLVLFERTVCGSLGYNYDIPRVLGLMASGRLDATRLVTDVRPLSAAVRTFEELTAAPHGHLKILLTPEED